MLDKGSDIFLMSTIACWWDIRGDPGSTDFTKFLQAHNEILKKYYIALSW